MATRGMALAFRITGGLSAGFSAATGRASRQLTQLKGDAADLSAELSREQAALRGVARGTEEYSSGLQRIEALKGRLRGLSGEIQTVGAQTRRGTQAQAAARAGMVRAAAVSGALTAALGATAIATARSAREYLELRLAAASAGVEAGDLAADIRRGTAVLGGNADAAKSAAQGALDYQKNLALLSVGAGSVNYQLAAIAGIDPWQQVGQSLEEVRRQNLAAIEDAKGLGSELERTRRLAAIEQLIGPAQFAALYQYTELTRTQRAEVDGLAERQRRAAEAGAGGWAGVSHSMGLLRGETGLLSQTLGGIFSPALEGVSGRLASGVRWISGWTEEHRRAAQVLGIAAAAVGGLGATVATGAAVMAGYRAVLWSVTGATQTGAAIDALRTGLIWRMTGAVAANTLAAGRNAAAWLAGRAVMLASAVATGAVTAAQWLLNIALTANPIGLVIAAVAGLIGGMVLLYQRSERFRGVVQSLWAGLKRFWPVLLGPIGVAVLGFQALYSRVEFVRAAIAKLADVARAAGGVFKAAGAFVGIGGGDDQPPSPGGGGRRPPPGPGGLRLPDYGLAAAATGQPQGPGAASPDYGLAAAATGQPQAAGQEPEPRLLKVENIFHISGVSDVEAVAQRVIELQDESLSELT